MTKRAGFRVDWPTAAGALMFILIGGGFAAFGGWQLHTTYAFLKNATEAPALVLDSNRNCDDDGCTYWPELEVTLPDGSSDTLKTQFGSSAYGFSEGSEITVLYNSDYSYVRVTGTSNLWLLGGAFFALGFPVCLLGFWLLFTHTVYRNVAS